MKLYLIRHGECHKRSADETDPSLNDEGIVQSERIGHRLKKLDISSIYYSPHRRTKETAEIIFNTTDSADLKLIENNLIKEKQDPDWFNAENRRDFPWDIIKKERIDPNWKLEEGESFLEIKERLDQALQNMIDENGTNKNIVWVTHNSVIKFILTSILLEDKRNDLSLFYDVFDKIDIKRGGYYTIEYRRKHYEDSPSWYLISSFLQ